ATSDRPGGEARGVELKTLSRQFTDNRIEYEHVSAALDHDARTVDITIKPVAEDAPASVEEIQAQGADFWVLALARELDDLLLHLRVNELELGSLVFHCEGDSDRVAGYDALLSKHADHWLVREVRLYWKRVLKRIDLTSRSLFAVVEPGSCYI